MKEINRVGFVDLYIGEDFADVTGWDGQPGRCVVPPHLLEDVNDIRRECEKIFNKVRDEEFSLNYDGIIFRVTTVHDVMGKTIFILRRSSAGIRPLVDIGLPKAILDQLLAKDYRGLILIAGEMATGKTSTAASLVVEWLRLHGGIGVSLEDPVETPLNGVWGDGRCIQVPVSRRRGGYKEAMPKALRTGASVMLIGEIRDSATAIEVLNASINGHFVISTLHAGSLVQAIERLSTYCLPEMSNANQLLAEGLSMVLWQSFAKPSANGNESLKQITRLKVQCLVVKDMTSVKAKIRDGKTNSLGQEVAEQATKLAWAMQESKS